MKKNLVIFFLFFLCAIKLSAQKPIAIHLTKSNGLPSNEVYNVYQDKKGFVWIATDEGLCKYDGSSFKSYYNASMSSKAGSFIREDKLGRIWYSNFDGKIFYVEHDSLKTFSKTSLMSIPGEFTLIGDTLVYVARNQYLKGINIISNQELFSQKLMCEYSSLYPLSKEFQLVTEDGIDIYNASFEIKTQIQNEEKKYFQKAIEYNQGYVSYRVFQKELNVFYIKNGLQKLIYSSKNDSYIQGNYLLNNSLWLLKKDGILKINIETLETESLLNNESVTHVFEDAQGYVWVSTSFNGIYIINPNQQTKNYPISSFNFKFNRFEDCLLIHDDVGRIFEFTGNGIIPVYNLSNKNQIYKIISLKGTSNLNISTSARNYDLFRYKGIDYLVISAGTKDIEILNDKYAAIAVSGMFGLLNYSKSNLQNEWDSLFIAKVLNDSVKFLTKGTSHFCSDVRAKNTSFDKTHNRIFYSSNIGLFVAYPSGIKELLYKNEQIFASTIVTFDGHTFCLQNNGELLYIEGNSLEQIQFKEIQGEIKKIKKIGTKLFLITEKEIYSFDIHHDFNSQKISLNKIHLNQPISELNDLEMVGNNYYLSYPNRIIVMDTSRFDKKNSYKFYINNIVSSKRTFQNTQQLIYSSNEHDITINFSILNYYQTAIQFEYRINNENWKPLKPSDRSIYLASLASGNYKVQFKLDGEVIKEEVNFTIKRPWYFQFWFIGIVLISLLLLSYLIYQRKIKMNSQENLMLLEKTKLEKDLRQSLLSSIKSQMNPHFLFNALNTIQSYIITEDKENASNYLSKFSKLTRKILDMSDKETITLQEEIDALILYVELEKMRFNDLNFTIEFDKEIVASTLLIPSMIIQPYVENAIKHGLLHKQGDKQLFIKIKKSTTHLIILIEDNGVGRKQSAIINKNKIDNHRSFATSANFKRIELLNAEKNEIGIEYFDKVNDEGEATGTVVQIKLPIKLNQ